MINNNKKLIAGIDDATKCPCIGSIFVAGVVADWQTIKKWKKLGVKDSKVVAAKKREKLAKIIKETASTFCIREVTPAQMSDLTFNLNDWEMLIVLSILNNISLKALISDTYIDNWEVNQPTFFKRYRQLAKWSARSQLAKKSFRFNRKRLNSINLIPEHKADENYTIVGAASILAKTASDTQYRKYKKQFGDFGSGSPADPTTRHFVWRHRQNPLPIIRTTWHTYKVISKLKNIDDDIIISKLKNKEKIKIS